MCYSISSSLESILRASLCAGILILVSHSTVVGQRAPGPDTQPKWDKIPEYQLRMDSFAADTLAEAVILSDFGSVSFRNDVDVVYDRHTRIKILSEAGYDWGTVSVLYRAEGGVQSVRNIKGQTFTTDENGKVQKHKMDKKSVFTEDVNGAIKRVRFTLPALEPGAVIEYSYQVISEGPQYMPNWQFQRSEPVLWSEFVAQIPAVYSYTQKRVGRHPLEVESVDELIGRNSNEMRWAMQDVPALREEPYMTTPDDYRSAIEFQLSGYMSNVGWTNYLVSWNEVAGELLSHPMFGGQMNASRAVRSQVEAVTAAANSARERLAKIYDFVVESVVWDESDGWLADTDMSQILDSKSGSRMEIHLLLIAMLREAGLDAYPVLISTRSNGQPIDEYPLLSQFNSSLVAVEFPSGRILLDGTDPLQPLGLLPADALNRRGWMVRESNSSWIPIDITHSYDHSIVVEGTLDADGMLSATVQSSSQGYAAVGNRRAMNSAGSADQFVKESLLDDLEDVVVETALATHLDSLSHDFEVEAQISIPAFAQTMGDFTFFTPVMPERFDRNPLRLPVRTFPVDTSYPRSISHTFTLELPAGWSTDVDELPKFVLVRLSREGGFFRREVKVADGTLTVETTFQIKRTLFEAHEYDELRSFFEDVVAAQHEQIVLSRTDS